MNEIYSRKSNAQRAARRAGENLDAISFVRTAKGWTWEDKPRASQSHAPAHAGPEAIRQDRERPRIRPHALLRDVRPDEIAACWEGVDGPLRAALKRTTAAVPAWCGKTPPEPGWNAVAEHWDRFGDDEKRALNKAAMEQAGRLRGITPSAARGPAVPEQKAPVKPRTRAYPQPADREAVAAGRLPSEPDFSTPTHGGYRKKLVRLTELARAGDLAALPAMTIPDYDSSIRTLGRYRALLVEALEARQR